MTLLILGLELHFLGNLISGEWLTRKINSWLGMILLNQLLLRPLGIYGRLDAILFFNTKPQTSAPLLQWLGPIPLNISQLQIISSGSAQTLPLPITLLTFTLMLLGMILRATMG